MNIIVVGKQSYLVNEMIEQLTKKEIGEISDFNYEVFDMFLIPSEDIVNSIMTLPFASDKKVVVVKHPFMLLGDKPTRLGYDYKEQVWLDYFEQSFPHATVIFECIGEKLDDAKAVTKIAKKRAKIEAIKDIDKKEWTSYIVDRLEDAHIEYERGVVEILEKRLLHDVQLLHNEIEKFQLFGSKITKEVALALVPENAEDDIYVLTNAVLDRKLAAALAAYRELKYTKKIDDTVMVLTQLASTLRVHYQVSILDRQGLNESQIATKMGIHPYRVKLAVARCRQTTALQFLGWIDALNTLDIEIKRGQVDSHQAFEMFLLKAAH